MATHPVATFDPLLSAADAVDMVRLCERFGSYGMYSEEPTFAGLGEGLPARWDAARNFVRRGGRFGRQEPLASLAARTNYFRETYAYGTTPSIDGLEPFLWHEGFIDAARRLHDRPIVEPAIVFANLLVPGQELGIHTDVPEFRGINRKQHPQWLIVAMHHSGLFERWRMPIATGVAWFHDCRGGEFAYYPDGADAPAEAHSVRYNTALLLDTDSVFHGVDRVGEPGVPLPPLAPRMRLRWAGGSAWHLTDGDRVVTEYDWSALRFSVSWKAYCFRDTAERDIWREHRDDLDATTVVERLLAEMDRRGLVGATPPEGHALADAIIDAFIHFPA
jgi:hypothetical protein